MKTNGLARILGERWDRPAVVADAEIDAIRQVLDAGLTILPHSLFARDIGSESSGTLRASKASWSTPTLTRASLVVSVELLQRSVAVEVDCIRGARHGPSRRRTRVITDRRRRRLCSARRVARGAFGGRSGVGALLFHE